jgi:hypothetical protein
LNLPDTYSCRFECPSDVTAFIVQASAMGIQVVLTELKLLKTGPGRDSYCPPDTYVEFVTEASYDKLLEIMRSCDDLHVGMQTLRKCVLSENSLERNYKIS